MYYISSSSSSFLVVTKPPYEITETGWGEFEIIIKIFFIDPNERPVSIPNQTVKACVVVQHKLENAINFDLYLQVQVILGHTTQFLKIGL